MMIGNRPYPRTAIRLLNGAGRALHWAGFPVVRFDDEQRLLKAARQHTGLWDFGDQGFRDPLRILLDAYDTEAGLTLLGRLVAWHDTLRLLINRLQLVEDRKRYPEIGAQQIRSPLFIVGLPRTGTTLLHNLLAQDPANRVPETWEALFPSPPPQDGRDSADPRIAKTDKMLRRFYRLAPAFKAIHPMDARFPTECVVIMSHTFASPQFQSTYHVPSYQSWLHHQGLSTAYGFHKTFLQHLQWRRPGTRWVLKAPSHLFALEELSAAYPDAVIVQTHRDPRKVIASVASLDAVLRRTFSDRIVCHRIGVEALCQWAEAAERAMQVRESGALPREQFFDVYYADLVRDPLEVVRRIYQRFDLPWSLAVKARMRDFLANHPRGLHGPHEYSLAQFGLTTDDIVSRFQGYLTRFNLREEIA